jgi:hypothetical protein
MPHNVPHQRRAANDQLQALYPSRVRCMRLFGGRLSAEAIVSKFKFPSSGQYLELRNALALPYEPDAKR